MTVISYWPSSVAASVVVPVPARQQINIGAGGIQSITRGQIVAALSTFSLSLYGPAGTLITNFTLDATPGTWSRKDGGASPYSTWTIGIPTTVYAGAGGGAGVYTVTIVYGSGAEYQSQTVAFQWGGWVDTLLTAASTASTQSTAAASSASTAATQATAAASSAATAATQATTAATQSTTAATQATTAATQSTRARKLLQNRVAPNDTTAPTALTVYDDDGTTPLGTRTIGNADGSAVSPSQILALGALV